jgi:hypothetical protein
LPSRTRQHGAAGCGIEPYDVTSLLYRLYYWCMSHTMDYAIVAIIWQGIEL